PTCPQTRQPASFIGVSRNGVWTHRALRSGRLPDRTGGASFRREDVQRTAFDFIKHGRDVFANQTEEEQLAAAEKRSYQDRGRPAGHHCPLKEHVSSDRKYSI